MQANQIKQARRQRRKIRIRKRVVGTPERPRLSVYRSLKHMYAQIIDDISGTTLVAASTSEAQVAKGGNKSAATAVGKLLAQKAKTAGITQVSFDRNAFRYHGRVKSLADAAREGGLKF